MAAEGTEQSTEALRALAPGGKQFRVRVGAAIVLVLLALGVAVIVALIGDAAGDSQTIAPGGSPRSDSAAGAGPLGLSDSTSAPAPDLLVHILGAVASPGLYSVRGGGRVIDAVAAAGGLSDDADPAGINLARPVGDGEQIIVPRLGEVPAAPVAGALGSAGALVDLNLASEAELEELPRIGPAMAARIVEWRESNGRFTSVEDLLGVTGIGEKTLDGLRDLVTV